MYIPVIYDRLAELAFKKQNGQISASEELELKDIFEKEPHKKTLFEELIDPKKAAEDLRIMDEFDVSASWEKVWQYSSK